MTSPSDAYILHGCPLTVNCIWGEWSAWGTCPVSCGGGTQERSRPIAVEAANGGVDCAGDASERRQCNTNYCDLLMAVGGDYSVDNVGMATQ